MSIFNWAYRFRFRERLRSSMWAVPMLFAIGAAVLEDLMVRAGETYNAPEDLQFSAGAATTVLSAIAGSMMTVTGIVFSVLTLTVQYAGASVSPRVVRTFYRDRVVKGSLGIFVGTFTYSLILIPDIDNPGSGVAVAVAVLLALISTGMFLVMVNHVGQGLRAASMVRRVNHATQRAIDQVHPDAAKPDQTEGSPPTNPDKDGRKDRVVTYAGPPGVVLAADFNGLARYASRRKASITLIPTVGDFIARDSDLFIVNEPQRTLNNKRLVGRVAVGEERTLDQDPAFGLRILTDTAIKALSPGVNDPTTAVVALDQTHDLLRTLASRDLGSGRLRDKNNVVRLTTATPTWSDYLDLALVEIAFYGAGVFQVSRRLHALLDDLEKHAPHHCQPAIAQHRQRLIQRTNSALADTTDHDYASESDPQGIGTGNRSDPR